MQKKLILDITLMGIFKIKNINNIFLNSFLKYNTKQKCLSFFVLQFQQKYSIQRFSFGNVCYKDNTNKTTLVYILCCNFNTNI